ncbi:MAG: hypothetical protein ACLTBV_04775 [Enterocloster bolteae]
MNGIYININHFYSCVFRYLISSSLIWFATVFNSVRQSAMHSSKTDLYASGNFSYKGLEITKYIGEAKILGFRHIFLHGHKKFMVRTLQVGTWSNPSTTPQLQAAVKLRPGGCGGVASQKPGRYPQLIPVIP